MTDKKTNKNDTQEVRYRQGGLFVEWLLRYRRPVIILAHSFVFIVSMFFAFRLVHMELLRRWFVYPFPIFLMIAIPIKLGIFGWFRQFRGWWRYVGISDLIEITKASVAGAIVLIVLWYGYSLGVPDLYNTFRGPEVEKHLADLDDKVIIYQEVLRSVGNEEFRQKLKNQAQALEAQLTEWQNNPESSNERSQSKLSYKEMTKRLELLNEALLQTNDSPGAELLQAELKKLREERANLQGLMDILNVNRILWFSRQAEQAPPDEVDVRERAFLAIKSRQRAIEGVIMLDLVCTIMILAGIRMLIRMYHEEFFTSSTEILKRLLIIGAGNAGEGLLREIMRDKVNRFNVVGFIDDDPAKQGMNIHGVTVLGKVQDLPYLCKKHNIDEIAIAMPSASRKQLRHVVQICQGTKLRFQTVPSITDIATGKLRVSQIRDVDINDLLGRDVVELDLDKIEKFLRDKTILVTGAGGSIGSEMCRQVCQFKPQQLLLVEQAENPLFEIERELRQSYPEVPVEAIVRNITDKDRMEQLFEQYKIHVVIHAAAHKHVPLMEINPGEAIKNNIYGTKIIAETADRYAVENFVMISTDKAVNPTSIMGSSKRIAEMYIQDLNNTSKTHFVTVRFGNVLGSNGSVVPIFKKQIAAGGPITVTHPEMKRYFMTIPEASQLVLQAATMGNGGEIFVLDMGEPVPIVNLARELITLSGFRPHEDIEIVYTGMRPGEKLFEELSIEGEDMVPTRHPKIGIWKNIPKDRHTLRSEIDHLVTISTSQDYQAIIAGIKRLVPEYLGYEDTGTAK
ncbi:MAG: polysaccharide biosynthesis protein [Sedimentisphaerales bacterium]|nr:polysaccharide biosynthesis protein [Sedimentisphaerales bacterium]